MIGRTGLFFACQPVTQGRTTGRITARSPLPRGSRLFMTRRPRGNSSALLFLSEVYTVRHLDHITPLTMSFDDRDAAHLRAFSARAQQPYLAARGPVNPGSTNPRSYGSVRDSTKANNNITVLSNQRNTNFDLARESFQQNGGPRW